MPFIKKRKKQQSEYSDSWSEVEVQGSSMWSQLEKKLKKLLGLC